MKLNLKPATSYIVPKEVLDELIKRNAPMDITKVMNHEDWYCFVTPEKSGSCFHIFLIEGKYYTGSNQDPISDDIILLLNVSAEQQ